MDRPALIMEMNIVKTEGSKQTMNIFVDQPLIFLRKIVAVVGRVEVFYVELFLCLPMIIIIAC